jgi:agmatinase
MAAGVTPVPVGQPTFLNMPRCEDLSTLQADVAIIGVPYGVPYGVEGSRQLSSTAPAHIRQQSIRLVRHLTHYEFDYGSDIFAGRNVTIVDCGDVTMQPGQYDANRQATAETIRAIIDRGAVPIILGGDHAIPIPVMRAYDGLDPMAVVQLDAHIDWREEVGGERFGLSSPMRRASELPTVRGMAQIGIRSVGSARQQEADDARAYGSVIVTAREVHRAGVEDVLSRIPQSDRYYITFDADGLDPTLAPGVNSPAFGGLSYDEASLLLRGVAAKGKIVGMDFVEVAPTLDINEVTSRVGARLILDLIGAMAHEGQIGK